MAGGRKCLLYRDWEMVIGVPWTDQYKKAE